MLVPRWITIYCIPWAICASVWIQGTTGESEQARCLAKDWGEVEAAVFQWPTCIETRWERKPNGDTATTSIDSKKITSEPSPTTVSVETASAPTPERVADQELDTDSPLDNANFLSFEDWKKQNLAKAGQSVENVGGNRRGTAGKDRRRPTGINNALDSLGDDAEIELDFVGFGADAPEATKSATSWGTKVLHDGGESHSLSDAGRDGSNTPVSHANGPRSKDAGTTCKERFNYASFDCAATVLKTNPQAKGSSSVLIENKDSYMLNECRAQNKFLILELCDDILVDTVVLANYEFFSSIFHTFRVSVADRYPAKPDQWKELGIYEARNTREIQAFAVENPLLWARYLRIEFLTHYGHEFYCPLSLIRVHGTTMLEEYKHDGEANRAEDDITEEVLEPAPEADTATETADLLSSDYPDIKSNDFELEPFTSAEEACPNPEMTIELVLLGLEDHRICGVRDVPAEPTTSDASFQQGSGPPLPGTSTPSTGDIAAVVGGGHATSQEAGNVRVPPAGVNAHFAADTAPATGVSDADTHNATSELDTRSTGTPKDEQSSPAESTRATTTQPPSANPTTQESFFKSVNKRLQMLETSSSLSLQYIEEQSRILRDAFNKVEKRQLSKTSTFLEILNVTVVNELKQFRDQYDQVWKSVALEFEHQRIQYHQEVYSLNTQLGVLADELVFQKRVAVIQSIVVLFCFGLVLVTRGVAGGYIDLPSVQSMVSRSYSLRSSSPMFGSLPGSPGSTRLVSSYRSTAGHRRQLSDGSQAGPPSPTIAYAPLTPTSDDSSLGQAIRDPTPSASGDSRSVSDMAPPFIRSYSSPPDLNGESVRDDGEGSEGVESESECSDSDER